MTIVAVGFNTPEENTTWAEQEEYTFDIWSDDEERTLALHYGAVASANANYPNRITRILGEDGYVLLEYNEVATGTHPQKVLDDCLILFGE